LVRILVVDDQAANLAMVRRQLEKRDIRIVTAESGEEAIAEVERDPDFDLFLIDVVLPGMDGFELCSRLRAVKAHEETPILFISGERSLPSDKELAFETGANDYLVKPLDPRELRARVSMMLRLAEARKEARRVNERLTELVAERTRALREALERIEEQRDLWHSLVKLLPILVIGVSREGLLVACNEEGRNFLGGLREGEPVAGTPLAPFFDEENWKNRDTLQRIVEIPGLGPRRFECTRNLLPLPNDGGGEYLVFHLRDVTDQQRMIEEQRKREMADLLGEIEALKGELHGRYRMSRMVWTSSAMAHIARAVDQLRGSKATVLIRGESGTGKELVARAIHFDGPLASEPFVPVHCGTIPKELAESEFFGYVKGAFTGADRDSPGLFRKAAGGTLFLDEIGELSFEIQGKLLRVLQSGEVRPVGSTKVERIDARLIAATNRDLWKMVRDGEFREDLYYRLDVVSLVVPPLRERPEDIAVLADHFLRKHAALSGRAADFQGISREALRLLEHHSWPGNVRELENVFVRAMALASGPVLQAEDLPPRIQGRRWSLRTPLPGEGAGSVSGRGPSVQEKARETEEEEEPTYLLPHRRDDAERRAILEALRRTSGNKLAAAKLLGIGKSSLYRKIKKLGIH